MKNRKRHFKLELISAFCFLFIVIMSAASLSEDVSTASLIGLIAGSFGAGATFTSAIRGYFDRRKNQS
jgi:hypothetical protein